ncbi:MAG TPA: hypothetical protein VMV37_15730 [Gammaproteobacteria bacterium]|nr:hypothetical protein [Gammaproteobacteria bacterium]
MQLERRGIRPAGVDTPDLRGLDTGIIANAVAVGIVSVLITSPFVLSARPEHRLMYCIAFVLRLVAAYLAGVVSSA